jgi:hypothetical protein
MTDPSCQSRKPPFHRLLRAAQPLKGVRPASGVLPLNSYTSTVGRTVVRTYSRTGIGHLLAGRQLLAGRLLLADPQKWRVSSLQIGPRIGGSKIQGAHPALMDPGAESVERLPTLPVENYVELEVDYVGAEDSGERLVACLLCAEEQVDDNAKNSENEDRDLEGTIRTIAQQYVEFAQQYIELLQQPTLDQGLAQQRGTLALLQQEALDLAKINQLDLQKFLEDAAHSWISGALVGAEERKRGIKVLRAESPSISPGEQVQLPLPPRAYDMHVSSLTLHVAEPSHWLVSDVLIGGDTLLVSSGDLPGELFADRPERSPLHLGLLRAQEELVVRATYTGPLLGASMGYEVTGIEVPTRDEAAEVPTSVAAAEVPNSAFLPMSTGRPILPTNSAQITGRVEMPLGYAFLPEEIILRDPAKWIVNDIKIENISLFASSGDVPGALFGARTRGCKLLFNAIPGEGCSLVLIATYIGENLEGEPLCCGVVGRVVRMPIA